MVLIWASEQNPFNIKNAKDAYAILNYGVSEVSDDGSVTIHLRTPQNYKDLDDKKG